MRVKVYELMPGPDGFVIDKDLLHCVLEVRDGAGSFKFVNAKREKLIRELFEEPSSRIVAGGQTPDGTFFDAMETHPAWSVEAIEAVVKDELYGHNLGATIEYDE